MSLIDEIRNKIARDIFEFSKHAADQALLRNILVEEIREATQVAEIIEDYPDDKVWTKLLAAWLYPRETSFTYSM